MKCSCKKSPLLWSGSVCMLVGFFWLLNQWFDVQRGQIRQAFIDGLPYILPISLMVVGATLVVYHINRD